MRRSTLTICALLTVGTYGCDKLKLAWEKLRGQDAATETTRPPTPPTPQAADSAAAAAAAAQGDRPVPQPPDQAPRQPSRPSQAVLEDVPFVSDDTGTIAPGMSENEIYTLWGAPAAVRRIGEYTYLFFRNGCEYTCGTMDVVTLQNGQVVDAVLRWDGHRYAGESSSPPGKLPVPNVGGDTLRIPPPTDTSTSPPR